MSDSLTSWIQTSFTKLYETSSNTSSTQLDEAFNSVFSSKIEITTNHVPTSRDELKQKIQERAFAAANANIEWKDIIEVPQKDGEHEEGIVAGSFTVTRSLKFRIRAAPAQTNNRTMFSVRIAQDASINEGDRRRIVELFMTSVDVAAPIRLQSSADA